MPDRGRGRDSYTAVRYAGLTRATRRGYNSAMTRCLMNLLHVTGPSSPGSARIA
jgi:hypothetical protein